MKVFDFSSHDGEKIYMSLWADVKEPKGVVQIVHGMSEHMGRYDEFAKRLNEAGYVVVGDDHRGHGKTAGELENVGKTGIGDLFTKTVKDLQFITANMKKMDQYAGLPYIVIGHSYGSFLTQRYLEYNSRVIDGVVLMGSACMKCDFTQFCGRVVTKFAKKIKPANFLKKMTFDKYEKMFTDGSWLSRDPAVFGAYKADPYCTQPYTYGFYRSLFYGFKLIYRKNELEKISEKLPIFIMSGSDDPVGGKGKKVEKLYNLYKNKLGLNAEMKLYQGARHELHNETNKDEVFADILSFIDSAIDQKKKNAEEAARLAEERAKEAAEVVEKQLATERENAEKAEAEAAATAGEAAEK